MRIAFLKLKSSLINRKDWRSFFFVYFIESFVEIVNNKMVTSSNNIILIRKYIQLIFLFIYFSSNFLISEEKKPNQN